MSDWWSAMESELDRLGADAPDPWRAASLPEVALTPEQVEQLTQVDDLAASLVDADDFLDDPTNPEA